MLKTASEEYEPPAYLGEAAIRGLAFKAFYVASGRPSFVANVTRWDDLYRGSRETLDSAVKSNLSALVRHACETVPFYRDFTYKHSDDNVVATLSRLPILTKDIIRREGKRLQSSVPGEKTRWNTSGGSTGEPVRLLQDHRMARDVTANKMLFMRWLGFRPGEPHLLIWGQPQETFHEGLSLRERVYRRVHNQTYLNCYEISDDVLRQWAEWIVAHRPSVIEAYADAIADLSRYVRARGIRLPRPRGIITSAGVLTEQMRDVVTATFRAPVLNRYGSREVGDVACSCLSENGLHISELSYFVEVVDANGEGCAMGTEGDVLVTLLSNYTMPLIRYRIEDRAAWASAPCSCGRITRRLVTVFGRRNDYLVARDGTHINGTALTTLLYSVAGIRRFQYRQTRDGVVLSIVPAQAGGEPALRRELEPLMVRARQLLRGTELGLGFVDQIPPSPSGKHRYIINDLQSQPPAGK